MFNVQDRCIYIFLIHTHTHRVDDLFALKTEKDNRKPNEMTLN
jgi:hypothetical protein